MTDTADRADEIVPEDDYSSIPTHNYVDLLLTLIKSNANPEKMEMVLKSLQSESLFERNKDSNMHPSPHSLLSDLSKSISLAMGWLVDKEMIKKKSGAMEIESDIEVDLSSNVATNGVIVKEEEDDELSSMKECVQRENDATDQADGQESDADLLHYGAIDSEAIEEENEREDPDDRDELEKDLDYEAKSSTEDKVLQAIHNMRVLAPAILKKKPSEFSSDVKELRTAHFYSNLWRELRERGLLKSTHLSHVAPYYVPTMRPEVKQLFLAILHVRPNFSLNQGHIFPLMNKMDELEPTRLISTLQAHLDLEKTNPKEGGANVLYSKLREWKMAKFRQLQMTPATLLTHGQRETMRVRACRGRTTRSAEIRCYQSELGLGPKICDLQAFDHILTTTDTVESLTKAYNLPLENGRDNVILFMVRLETLVKNSTHSSRLLLELVSHDNIVVFMYNTDSQKQFVSIATEALKIRDFGNVSMHVKKLATTLASAETKPRKVQTQEGAVNAAISIPERFLGPVMKSDKSPCENVEAAIKRLGAVEMLPKIKYIIKVNDSA